MCESVRYVRACGWALSALLAALSSVVVCVCLFCEAPALMDWLRPQGLGFRRREEGGRRREEFFFAYVPMGLPCTGAGWPCPRPGCAPGCVGGCAPGCVGGPRESHIVGSFLHAGASQSFASADTDYGSQRFLSCLASGLGGERGGGGGRRRGGGRGGIGGRGGKG